MGTRGWHIDTPSVHMTGRCEIRQKCAPRDPEKNWNKDQPRKSLPGVPRVGDKNCKKAWIHINKATLPQKLGNTGDREKPKAHNQLGWGGGEEREKGSRVELGGLLASNPHAAKATSTTELLPCSTNEVCIAVAQHFLPKRGNVVTQKGRSQGGGLRVWDTHLVASSIFFRECRSLGSVCCRFKYSETALAGNSVSQIYPKSRAKWTASPEKTAAEVIIST